MLSSTVLDVAIGLIFTFLAFSLAVSAIVEAIASVFKWRSNTLLKGVKDLLNDQDLKGLALNLYNHALINPREPGTAAAATQSLAGAPLQTSAQASTLQPAQKPPTDRKAVKMGSQRPAYINPNQFGAAMIDILKLADHDPGGAKKTLEGMKAEIAKIDNRQLQQVLNGIVDRTDGDLAKIQTELAGWFDNAMDRVGGSYKRRTQLWGFIIALVMAALLNVSAINIGQALWRRPMMAKAIGPQADLTKQNVIAKLDALEALDVPIGWNMLTGNNGSPPKSASFGAGYCLTLFVGWMITAIATLFGRHSGLIRSSRLFGLRVRVRVQPKRNPTPPPPVN
jgi:hypothetical protein